jgi:ATP-dependent RNA helicase DeaD
MSFEELGLRQEVLKSIQKLGFESPTPIQEQAIPHLLQEESDFVGLAQTGTGKTAAFGLPLISKVDESSKVPQGLVICPTRELCLQISKDLESFASNLKVKVVAVYGGTDIRRQMKDIKAGVNVIVATPGRLVDLIKRGAVQLQDTEWVVLDEADEMLNMGFKEDIDTILEKTPQWKNVWLFSATMPKEVARIAKNYMENPLEVSIGHKNQTNENIEHIYYTVKERDRYPALKRLIDYHPSIYGLVFCRTRRETAAVAEKLGKEGYSAEPLHGDLSQAQRDAVMRPFREKNIQILVSTDVAARGIDVDDITHVINYNLPDETENYTHRSGRTARAGKKGQSLVLINTREGYKIKSIEKIIRTEFKEGLIPSAKQICEIQLMKLVDKVISTKVKENDIAEFLPLINTEFDGFTKEEVIKKFVSAEFNRFIDYYERAGDVNAKAQSGRDRDNGRGRGRDRDRNRGRRGSDENKTRFFVSLGAKDGLNAGGLLRVICDETGLTSGSVGRIDIMEAFSFFEADNQHKDKIIAQANGAQYEGKRVKIEVTHSRKEQRGKRGGGGNRSRRDRDRKRNRGRR